MILALEGPFGNLGCVGGLSFLGVGWHVKRGLLTSTLEGHPLTQIIAGQWEKLGFSKENQEFQHVEGTPPNVSH